MTYAAIMRASAEGRVEKLEVGFASLEKAQEHCQAFAGQFPSAFAVKAPDAPWQDWKCDSGAETVSVVPFVNTELRRVWKLALDRQMEQRANEIAPARKSLVYAERIEEAREASADESPRAEDYPLLAALVGSNAGRGIKEVAASVLLDRAKMRRALAALDQACAIGKARINEAETDPEAEAAFVAARADLTESAQEP